MSNQINYSIIIPHKNTIELLKNCIDSIPQRGDIQIIIADDNSDSYNSNFDIFTENSNITIINSNEGIGAGAARNAGLKKAFGKWILFADADDLFIEGFIEHLDKYLNSQYDLIYFGIQRIAAANEKKKYLYKEYDYLIQNAINKKEYDAYKYKSFFPWGKMIKTSLIKDNNITFDETIVANDMMFSIKTAYHSKNTFFNSNKIYKYIAQNSQLTKIKSIESDFIRFCVYVNINCFLKNINKNKYKKDLIMPLKKLIKKNNMNYFHNALIYMKKNNIIFIIELLNFFILFPSKIFYKLLYR